MIHEQIHPVLFGPLHQTFFRPLVQVLGLSEHRAGVEIERLLSVHVVELGQRKFMFRPEADRKSGRGRRLIPLTRTR